MFTCNTQSCALEGKIKEFCLHVSGSLEDIVKVYKR